MKRRLKLRELTQEEVTFIVEVEPEETPVSGNVVASGDESYDREVESRIIKRVESGDLLAWCTLKTTASWGGYAITIHLGCCTIDSDECLALYAREAGEFSRALEKLNNYLSNVANSISSLIVND